MATILEVKNAGVSFDDGPVVHGVSFALEDGEGLVIIRPNGAGKTVFLRALLGSVPHEGEIIWSKHVKIGYVPQKINADRLSRLISKICLRRRRVSSVRPQKTCMAS